METIIAVAPGKLILLGEYAVLEGAPALVAAVDRFSRVTLIAEPGKMSRVEAPVLTLRDKLFYIDREGKVRFDEGTGGSEVEQLTFFSKALEYGWQTFRGNQRSFPPARFHLDTGAFFLDENGTKLGLGSSAALTVALTGTLRSYLQPDIPWESALERLFDVALKAHRAAQKNVGSGIDIAASTFGGLLQYQFQPAKRALPVVIRDITYPATLFMRFIWTGRSASTANLVRQVIHFREKAPTPFQKVMDKMRRLSAAGCQAMRQQAVSDFLDSIRGYYQALKTLGELSDAPIISTVHQQIADIVYQHDAVYKPSGAGGGDLGIVFGTSEDILDSLVTMLREAGFINIDLGIAPKGFQIKQKEVN